MSGALAMLDVPNNLGDGHVLPAMSTEEIFSNPANHNPVPVILGTNRDEVALFMAMSPQWQDSFLWIFPRIKDEDLYLKAVRYGSASWKARGVDSLADYLSAAGNSNVYAYRFDWDEEGSVLGYDLSKAFGAAHGMEIPFVFGNFGGGFFGNMFDNSPNMEGLSDSMMSYWAEFAVNGDPGQGRDGSEVHWQAWGENGVRSLILDTVDDRGIRMEDEVVTIAGLKAELAADPDLNQQQRCHMYVAAFGMFGFDDADYRSFGPDGCAGIDPSQFGMM
jgi:para-nitrobenzyl esterase